MMELINVSSRGQVVIPERIRKHLGIKQGSRLILFEKQGEIILKKEEELTKHLLENDKKETIGWMKLAEKSLQKIWNNPKDEEVWKRYL